MTPLSVRFFDLSARGEQAAYRYGGQHTSRAPSNIVTESRYKSSKAYTGIFSVYKVAQ